MFCKSDDSSIENDDSSLKNDDSSRDNDDFGAIRCVTAYYKVPWVTEKGEILYTDEQPGNYTTSLIVEIQSILTRTCLISWEDSERLLVELVKILLTMMYFFIIKNTTNDDDFKNQKRCILYFHMMDLFSYYGSQGNWTVDFITRHAGICT